MFDKLIAALVLFFVLSTCPLLAQDNKHTLVLSGHGEIMLAPDMAIVDFGVEAQAPTAKAALEANTRNMAVLMATLKSASIEDKDIQTRNFSVQPRYDDKPNGSPPRIIGYAVNNSVSVIVHKIDSLGTLLDKAVAAGTNQVSNISFTVSSPQEAQDEARRAAVKDALRKANVLTEAAGIKLGALQSMSEQGGNQVMPMAKMSRMAAAPMAQDAMPVPVAQGQVMILADVNMVWEIQ